MENVIMQSKKINRDKTMRNFWLSLVVILVVSLLVMAIKYIPVKKAQDIIIFGLSTTTDDYDEYKNNRGKFLKQLESDFNRGYAGGNDIWANMWNANIDRLKAREEFADDLLDEAGYGNKSAYTWVSYGTFAQYYLHEGKVFAIVILILFAVLGTASLLYSNDKKTELSILDNAIIGKKSNGKTVQFLLKDITSVETTKTHGLRITGAGIKYDIHLIQNSEEMKNKIMDMLAKIQHKQPVVAVVGSSVRDIKEYKELLDAGIITQEEFDAKKKELLNL